METLTAWSRALRDPALRDLPYKIETNEFGQLVMAPQKPRHGYLQARLVMLLSVCAQTAGRSAVEFAVETSRGVKVPDVVWISEPRWLEIPEHAEASPIAPDVCIEVLSSANTRDEIADKRLLYFERGAREVWTCDGQERVRFYDSSGPAGTSSLFPDFPGRIE